MLTKRRLTKQRKLILDTLRASHEHLSADKLYEALKENYPELSLGTVYRNLNVLQEQGEIIKIEGDFPSSRYDGNTTPHHHIYCTNCEEIHDVDMSYCTAAIDRLEAESGYKIDNYSILFTGTCNKCKF